MLLTLQFRRGIWEAPCLNCRVKLERCKCKIKCVDVAPHLESMQLDSLRSYALGYRREERGKRAKTDPTPTHADYMCLTSRQSSPLACLLEICEVTGHMVHTGQLFSPEWND